MIAVNSNCSRVDAVKASATQLKLQVDQAPKSADAPASDSYRKAQSQIQSLDTAVKQGDAQKAETALATAKSAVQQFQTQTQGQNTSKFPGRLDVYA
jgi:hypothetical protein